MKTDGVAAWIMLVVLAGVCYVAFAVLVVKYLKRHRRRHYPRS